MQNRFCLYQVPHAAITGRSFATPQTTSPHGLVTRECRRYGQVRDLSLSSSIILIISMNALTCQLRSSFHVIFPKVETTISQHIIFLYRALLSNSINLRSHNSRFINTLLPEINIAYLMDWSREAPCCYWRQLIMLLPGYYRAAHAWLILQHRIGFSSASHTWNQFSSFMEKA